MNSVRKLPSCSETVDSILGNGDPEDDRTPVPEKSFKHNSLIVGELKNLLSDFPDDLPVFFGYDYGDHWHSQVAGEIIEAEQKNVIYSDYHRMAKVADEEYDDQVGGMPAVVLGGIIR